MVISKGLLRSSKKSEENDCVYSRKKKWEGRTGSVCETSTNAVNDSVHMYAFVISLAFLLLSEFTGAMHVRSAHGFNEECAILTIKVLCRCEPFIVIFVIV